MTQPQLPQLMTLEELSQVLAVPVRTIRKWRERGVGPRAYRVGGALRYAVDDVAAWLATVREDGGQR